MKPDTSRWRDSRTYDYFDDLSVEGLAWECLRRDASYQQAYRDLVDAERAAAPLPAEAEHLWGLRCRRETLAPRDPSACPLVTTDQSGRHHPHRASRPSAKHGHGTSRCACRNT
ncbi:transcriptional regulator domain-containing protein [Ancylobacter sp. G4_0304]|uniref:transcriptional regulator domain-containing protein n=1 Tax=Ancylobacter sp. G4_0304 TaxID=3114289 RepID=UPI0039C5D054